MCIVEPELGTCNGKYKSTEHSNVCEDSLVRVDRGTLDFENIFCRRRDKYFKHVIYVKLPLSQVKGELNKTNTCSYCKIFK